MLHPNPSRGGESATVFDVRLSTGEGDDPALIRRLAATVGGTNPAEAVFVAELDGELVAAVGLAGGEAIVDPSRADPAIVRYLRLRRLEANLIASIWGG
jgi:hypothetical protein